MFHHVCLENTMQKYICTTCGTQYAGSEKPPHHCPICEDDRQYVGWGGQNWTTHEALVEKYKLRIEDDCGLLGIGMPSGFAIPQRALLLPTDDGNVLWECVSMVTDAAVAEIKSRGGVRKIVISHPHFYTSMIEWSEALGGVPILLNAADKAWIQRHAPQIEFWDGDVHRLSDQMTLLRVGGHFPGSSVLHWKQGPRAGGALFPGDALQVVYDRRHVSFMYSYPNFVPMKTSDVRAIRERLIGYDFADVFGFTWGLNIIGGGRAAVDASFDRFLAAVEG